MYIMIRHGVKRRYAYIVAGSLALSALWFGVSYFTLGATGGSIQDVSLDASLNDEMSGSMIQGEGGAFAGSCAGPPPDHFVVDIEGTLDLNTPEGRYVDSTTYELVVGIGENTGKKEVNAVADGPKQVRDMLMIQDDESVAPGEQTTVTVSLKQDGERLDSVTREVTVEEQNMRCSATGG